MKTQNTKALKASQVKRVWHLVDLKDQVLGRISTQVASYLIGKDKAFTSPNIDHGDFVVAINAKDIRVTGKKRKQKLYQSHSGFPGGFKEFTFDQMMARDPRKVIEKAVKGMLPKNKLRDQRMSRLKVFTDSDHPHLSQLSKSQPSQKINNQAENK